jgi:hypothetical protein
LFYSQGFFQTEEGGVTMATTVTESNRLNERFVNTFPEIISALRDSPYKALIVDNARELIGVGDTSTVILKHVTKGVGFGLVWRQDRRTLEGMRSQFYRADDPESAASRAFMLEFQRRLQTEGASLADLGGNDSRSGYFVRGGRRRGRPPKFVREMHARAY